MQLSPSDAFLRAQSLLESIRGTSLSLTERQEQAIALAAHLLVASGENQSRKERKQQAQLARMMQDPQGKAFTTAMTDQCFRSPIPARVANQMRYLLEQFGTPQYLSAWRRFELDAFYRLSKPFSAALVPLAKEALRHETDAVILPGEEGPLTHHMKRRRAEGVRLNLNHLGEAILGEEEAKHRLQVYLDDLARPDIEYVSIKISTIYSQINLLGWEHTLERLKERLRPLYRACQQHVFVQSDGTQVPKFVNLDMEEYRDLRLTKVLFQEVLDEPEFLSLSAGIVLQAYLPDSYELLQELTTWAKQRVDRGGAPIKVRIVKGANLAMEQVEASVRGWPQAPYRHKLEVDANFKRMLLFATQPAHTHAVRIGIGSHNLFDIAYALLLRAEQQVEDQVSFEMLEGMAESLRRVVQWVAGGMLLYCPVAKREDFQSAIAYLIRRLDENTGPENFLRHTFGLTPDSPAWNQQADFFRKACEQIETISSIPRRQQDRLQENSGHAPAMKAVTTKEVSFLNEPDTDFSLPANQSWARAFLKTWQEKKTEDVPLVINGTSLLPQASGGMGVGTDPSRPEQPLYRYALADWPLIDRALQAAKEAEPSWKAVSVAERVALLRTIAEQLRQHRAALCGAMVADGGKTIPEADPEVSEAIDFAEYYAHSLEEIDAQPGVRHQPKGTVLVAPPWNFPVSIPAGGILAALAAGNCVLFKPAPETVLCGWVLVQLFWQAGVPKHVLQFINCEDEPVGSRLISDPRLSVIVLTGATSTAKLFKRLNPQVPLYAETGGKNAMIVTSLADRDLAIKDLVHSAFGHGGQKCSATSLAILEADVYDDPQFMRQLRDAVMSLRVGSAWDPSSKITPLIRPPGETLLRGLTTLEEGESWLVEPKPSPTNPNLWSPGIKLGVKPGSFVHQTELFGPVLGIMRAEHLDQAIEWANGTPYGLTSGLQSLDEREHKIWQERLIAGNLYINRGTTGAIVERQPFGGCKASSFGPGAKAGGPNYVPQLMNLSEDLTVMLPRSSTERVSWIDTSLLATFSDEEQSLWDQSITSYAEWAERFRHSVDPARLQGQDNLFGYRPATNLTYRMQRHDRPIDVLRTLVAAEKAKCPLRISFRPGETPFPGAEFQKTLAGIPLFSVVEETELQFLEHVRQGKYPRIRLLSPPRESFYHAVSDSASVLLDAPVLRNGRFELLHFLREVSISIDYHRYGNLGPREGETRQALS